MLTIQNLNCGYDGEDVIHDVNLSVKAGERLYIAGPNGCGKTTLLKCIAALLPYRGEILLDQVSTRRIRKKELARKIGIMTQISNVYFPYTIAETVALGRYAHRNGVFAQLTPSDRDYVEECIERVGLGDLRNRRIDELSGGQLQRVFLARLFAQNPEIILLDEPTNHLDLKYQIELLQYVTSWSAETGKTVIGVLHDLNLVHEFAGQVVLMSEGKIFSQGTPEQALSGENLETCYQIGIRGWMKRSLSNWE